MARDGVHRDRDVATERQRLAAAHAASSAPSRRRSPPAGGRDLLRLALGVVQVAAAPVEVLLDVRRARAQHRRVGLVDDDLGAAAGQLPQRVGTADVVDVAVGQQDPAHVLDAAADGLERGRHALGGRRRDARVDDGRLGRVDEEAVEAEPAPRRDQRVDRRRVMRSPARNSAVSSKARWYSGIQEKCWTNPWPAPAYRLTVAVHAGLPQPPAVELALVAQRVVLGGDDRARAAAR